MIKLDNRITPLILFLKDWIKINGLYGRPRFSSYALVMLVFYYLQQEPNPILPSVELLQNRGSRKIIGGIIILVKFPKSHKIPLKCIHVLTFVSANCSISKVYHIFIPFAATYNFAIRVFQNNLCLNY